MPSDNRRATDLRVRRLTFSALCLALAMVLPFLTGQIPQIGRLLSPMHIPAFLCGFLCGWPWGVAVGVISPILRGVIFGMPALFPTGVAMAFELAVYGAAAGIMYRVFRRTAWGTWAALGIAMVAGRVTYGLVMVLMVSAGLTPLGEGTTLLLVFLGPFTNTIPAVLLHAALVPPIVIALERAGMAG